MSRRPEFRGTEHFLHTIFMRPGEASRTQETDRTVKSTSLEGFT
jgi:hypothetical protein